MSIALFAVLCLASWAVPCASESGRVARDGSGRPGTLNEASERLDLLRMWRLIDRLEVREDQAADLFPMWSRHRRERRDMQAERARLAKGLTEALDDSSGTESQLLKWMGRMEALDARLAEAEGAFRSELAQVLDVRQRARLMLFPEQFRGEVSEMIRGLRGMPSYGSRQGGGRGWSAGRSPSQD